MAAVGSLSDSDVAAIRREVATGDRATVWFTPAAVGVRVGGSARVVSVGEVAEGEFIEVKAAGSRDTMFCSPNELTRIRPPRKRAPRPDAGEAAAAQDPEPVREPAAAQDPEPVREPVAARGPVPAGPARARSGRRTAPGTAAPLPGAAGSAPGPEQVDAPAPAGRRSAPRRSPSGEVTIMLAASPEGEWTVEVTVGRKRVVRSLPVQPAEVAKAARSLPAPVAEAIEASLAAARQRQTERVERLRAELDAAQRALRDLDG